MAKQGVLVFAEVKDGKLLGVAREAVALGNTLVAQAGGEVSAVVIAGSTAEHAKALIAAGAKKVYAADNPALDGYQPDAHLQVLQRALDKAQPKVVIMGQTDTGKDLAPKLAFRNKASLTMDSVDVAMNGGAIRVTKPVYGGNAQAIYESNAEMHVVCIRAKAFEATEPNTANQGAVEKLDATIDESKVKVRVTQVKKQESTGIRMEDAPIIVSGGRGLGGPEPFAKLQELAKALGGAVGASRAVCDAGWLPHSFQVGLTGKTVTPDLYIAVAISGASQHMAGCSGAKSIVAINKDKDANIFKEARFGVVGNWEEILPAFMEMVKELRGS